MVIRALIKVLHPRVIPTECFTGGAYFEDAEPTALSPLLYNSQRDLELPMWVLQGQTELGFPAGESFGLNIKWSCA